MKLACQRCATAYTVADSKIAGKRAFRWRCRRCGEDIVVRRDEQGATTLEPLRASVPTESRDSNSVLFSLAMLQARAEPPRARIATPRAAIDAILTVGNVPASSLIAPVVPPTDALAPRAGSSRVNKSVILAAIAGAVIVANGGMAIAMLARRAPAPLTHSLLRVTSPKTERTPRAETVSSQVVIATSPIVGASVENAPITTATRPAADRVRPRSVDAPRAAHRPIEVRTDPTSHSAHATHCVSLCHGDATCLMQCAVQPRPTVSAHPGPVTIGSPTPHTELPAAPQRSDVSRTLDSARSSVNDCAQGRPGTASVTVTFAGSGRVTTANVAGTYAGTPAGSCIAMAMRRLSVPPFARPSFMVTYPYAVR